MARDITTINKLIKTIKTRSAKQREDIQQALVECALFAYEDRNTDPAIRLFAAVGNDTNRKAMSHWLSTNACIHFKDEKPVLSDKRQKEMAEFTAEERAEYLESLATAPKWHEHAADSNTATNVWDHGEQLEKLREYLDKVAKRAKKNNDAELAKLATLMAANITKVE